MKKIYYIIILVLTISCTTEKKVDNLKIEDFKFESFIGYYQVENSNDLYCLLGLGFFQTPRSEDADSLINLWITKHPNAIIIPISSFGLIDVNDSDGRMIYCWVVDEKENLNIYLVENGCFPGGTMQRPDTWEEMEEWEKELLTEEEKPNIEVHINDETYEQFIEKIKVVEEHAKENKLGIWRGEENE